MRLISIEINDKKYSTFTPNVVNTQILSNNRVKVIIFFLNAFNICTNNVFCQQQNRLKN